MENKSKYKNKYKNKYKSKKININKLPNLLLKYLPLTAMLITTFIFVFIIGYIVITGLPNMSLSLFQLKYTSDNASALPALINTLIVIGLTLLLALPIGVFSAIYLTEYANNESRIVSFIRLTTETLAGIPSIVYGLFGMLMFVSYLNFGYSILSGILTLFIMVLPTIIRTTEESLIAVPQSYREASFALGAGKIRTIFVVILPSAMAGILSGVMLSIGRIIGESAALIFTAGTVAQIPTSTGDTPFLLQSARTLSVHMYMLSSEGLHMGEAQATALILLVLVIVINIFAIILSKKLTKNY